MPFMLRWTSMNSGMLTPLAGRSNVYASRRFLATRRRSSHHETGDEDRRRRPAHPGLVFGNAMISTPGGVEPNLLIRSYRRSNAVRRPWPRTLTTSESGSVIRPREAGGAGVDLSVASVEEVSSI